MIEYSLHITNGQNYSFININKEYLKETIAPSLNLPSDDETNHFLLYSANCTLIAENTTESFFCSMNSLIALKCQYFCEYI